jgi:exopolysaccharide biosynthesis polyprenyl glycosylphosphotransferase
MFLGHHRHSRVALQIMDGVLAFFAMFLAYWIRVGILPTAIPLESREIGQILVYLPYAILMGIATPIVLERRGFYRHLAINPANRLSSLLEVALILFLLAVSLIFFFKESPSRLVFLIFVPILTGLLNLRQALVHKLRQVRKTKSESFTNLILVSDTEFSTRRWPDLFTESGSGIRITRHLNPAKTSLPDFIQTLHDDSAGIVLFEVESHNLTWSSQAIQACEEEGVEAWLSTHFVGTKIAQAHFEEILDQNLLVFRNTQAGPWQSILKIIFDRLASGLMITLLSPVFLLIWAAIRRESAGPAIFKQKRSGRHGAPFTMYKFRTMVSDAEMRQAELKALNEMSGPVFKIKNDPRVTRVGAFLRFTSLDELPQLFNVFLGQMSLVGPRPLPTYETIAMTANAQRRRLSVLPGMTCLWQISGRNDVNDFSDWVQLDLEYIDQWSLLLDFQILLRTIPAVLFGRGAR